MKKLNIFRLFVGCVAITALGIVFTFLLHFGIGTLYIVQVARGSDFGLCWFEKICNMFPLNTLNEHVLITALSITIPTTLLAMMAYVIIKTRKWSK